MAANEYGITLTGSHIPQCKTWDKVLHKFIRGPHKRARKKAQCPHLCCVLYYCDDCGSTFGNNQGHLANVV